MKARMPKVTHPSTIRGMQRASRHVTTRRAGPLISLSFRHASRTHPDTSLPKAAPTSSVRAQFVPLLEASQCARQYRVAPVSSQAVRRYASECCRWQPWPRNSARCTNSQPQSRKSSARLIPAANNLPALQINDRKGICLIFMHDARPRLHQPDSSNFSVHGLWNLKRPGSLMLLARRSKPSGTTMLTSRMHATRVLAITGAMLCLVFLLAVIVLA
jgi:hypothetical protein